MSEGELKCVSEEDMALSVMKGGTIKMLLLFADNLDFLLMVCALESVDSISRVGLDIFGRNRSILTVSNSCYHDVRAHH